MSSSQTTEYSRTALVAALIRQYHQQDEKPLVFNDSLAEKMVLKEERDFIEKRFIDSLGPAAEFLPKGLTPSELMPKAVRLMPFPAVMLARYRYCEDHFIKAHQEQSINQYVILGAGLDTFALRHSELQDSVNVFEIDMPASQEFKQKRLKDAGLSSPKNLNFIPVDFEHQTLQEALKNSPFNENEPAFFAWLGVTMYLTTDSIWQTLKAVNEIASPGSQIVFDYLDDDAFSESRVSLPVKLMLDILREEGEPMISSVNPDQLASQAGVVGFKLLNSLPPKVQQQEYFASRNDGLKAADHFHIAHLIK